MKLKIMTAMAAIVLGTGAAAQSGDAEAGERTFNQCKSCHMIQDADGEMIVRGGRTGPNLWGVIGRAAGSVEDFRYSDALVSVGEDGYSWDEEGFIAYTQDPTGWLREKTGDDSARGKMSYRVRKEEDAADIWAYLASVSPAPDMDGEAVTN
jgi:cytochrome c